MAKNNSTRTQLALLLVGIGLVTSGILANSTSAHHDIPTFEECMAGEEHKLTICHAPEAAGNPYVEITIDCNALYGSGNAGHFEEDGTTQAGHEDDFVLHEGQSCNAVPTAEPTASPTPSPSAEPSSTPSPSPTATPTQSSTQETGGPGSNGGNDDNAGRHTSLSNDNLVCSSKTFDAVFDVKEEGRPISGKFVHFTFNGQEKGVNTNDGGRAKVTFDQAGATSGILTATTEGYPSQSMYITIPTCQNVALDPDRSRGQVLGATTLAETGRTSEYSAYLLMAAGFVTVLASAYAFTKNQVTA